MAERVISGPPEDLGPEHGVPTQMIQDLHNVARIPAERIDQLAEALQAEQGFLDEGKFARIVAEQVGDVTQTNAAIRAIQNLRPQILTQALEIINSWRELDSSNKEQFPDEAFAALREKLPLLVREYPALSRMRKANRLRVVLGNHLTRAEFICDARPVFDQDRRQIEGLLALTTMKLSYQRQNNTTEEVEILINGQQLNDLIHKAEKAREKLRVLEASFAEWVIPEAE